MGLGYNEKAEDSENPQSEDDDDRTAERRRMNAPQQADIELKTIPTQSKVNPLLHPDIIQVASPSKPLMKTSTLKYAMLGFNGILGLLGLVILILATWIRSDPEFWEYKTTLNVETFYTVCHMFIVAGIFVLIVAFLGCCGAVIESQVLLTAYFIIFAILFILELSAMVMIWSAPYSKTLSSELRSGITNQVEKRTSDDASRLFVDFIQANLHCCGSIEQEDYGSRKNGLSSNAILEIPNSCKDPKNGSAYSEGCSHVLLKYLKTKAGVIGGISLPILLFHILALGVSSCLIYNIKKESSYIMD